MNTEPDLGSGPGGLRDAIARRVAGQFHCDEFGGPASRDFEVADKVLDMGELRRCVGAEQALRDMEMRFRMGDPTRAMHLLFIWSQAQDRIESGESTWRDEVPEP
jgi:hypothetical protein